MEHFIAKNVFYCGNAYILPAEAVAFSLFLELRTLVALVIAKRADGLPTAQNFGADVQKASEVGPGPRMSLVIPGLGLGGAAGVGGRMEE